MRALVKRQAMMFAGIAISSAFLYPLYWMVVSSFRTQEQILSNPLRLLPEAFDFKAYETIQKIGGVELWVYALNSIFLTLAATALGVVTTALGAYALVRKPNLPLFGLVRFGFLMTMMYPAMLLVMPVYIVMFQIGMLGTMSGMVLFLSLMPVLFLILMQFFRSIPRELLEAAAIDGASEAQILWRVVLPITRPMLMTVFLIGFLLNWKQWLPILVIASTSRQYTLPVALLSLNTQYGVDFQSTMALASLTTIPAVVLFVLTQRRIIQGLTAGSVKG